MTPIQQATIAVSEAISELVDVLRDSEKHARQLLAALETERDALREGDVDAIHAAVARKQASVSELEALDGDRLQLCAAAALPEDLAAVSASDAAGRELGTQWTGYLDTLERCRDANLVNARVTTVRRRHVERALSILRGDDGQSTAVYGPAGQREMASSHELGQA